MTWLEKCPNMLLYGKNSHKGLSDSVTNLQKVADFKFKFEYSCFYNMLHVKISCLIKNVHQQWGWIKSFYVIWNIWIFDNPLLIADIGKTTLRAKNSQVFKSVLAEKKVNKT